MKYKYGEITNKQLTLVKKKIRAKIYFALLIVEKKYDYDADKAIVDVLLLLSGLNELLNYPKEIIIASSLLEEARKEIDNYKFYRKLIFDAGNEIAKIGGDTNAFI